MTALEALAEFYGERFWKLPHLERECMVRDAILVSLEDLPGAPMREVVQELDRRIGNALEGYTAVLAAVAKRDAARLLGGTDTH